MTTNLDRRAALALGIKTYPMTKECKYGHLGERYTSCGICVECSQRKQEEMRVKVSAGRRLHNTQLFEPGRVYSTIVKSEHREVYEDLQLVCTHGTAEQVEHCAAFLNMIRQQVIAPQPAPPPGELNRAALAAHVSLDPATLGYLDGSPLTERYDAQDELQILIAARWYVARRLAEVWKGTRATVRPVRAP